MERIDLTSFKRDSKFYGSLKFLITVKSFDLQAIRKRYLESKRNPSGRAGSVERRDPGLGGVVGLELSNGKMASGEVLAKLREPRGVDAYHDCITVAAENVVHIWKGHDYFSIQHPWFSYIHTVFLSRPDADKLLISSSGLDCLFEYKLPPQADPSWEWFAWENGFDKGNDPKDGKPVRLTRDPSRAAEWERTGERARLIHDPMSQTLPTAMRAAFINSAIYDTDSQAKLFATFFHEGSVYSIDQITGKADKVLDGLKNPHGGRRYKGGILATSTGHGEVVWKTDSGEHRYNFSKLPGKAEGLENLEWLQNTASVGEFLVTIDSNRTSFIIFDPEQALYDIIPYDPDWAVQDLMPSEGIEEMWENIKRISDD